MWPFVIREPVYQVIESMTSDFDKWEYKDISTYTICMVYCLDHKVDGVRHKIRIHDGRINWWINGNTRRTYRMGFFESFMIRRTWRRLITGHAIDFLPAANRVARRPQSFNTEVESALVEIQTKLAALEHQSTPEAPKADSGPTVAQQVDVGRQMADRCSIQGCLRCCP